MKIDKIYIIHYPLLADRKLYLDDNLHKFNIPYEFRSKVDRDSDIIHNVEYIDLSDTNREKRNKIYENYTYGSISSGVDRDSWKANLLEHFFIFEEFAKSDMENIMVFEDDVIFNEQIFSEIDEYLKVLPKSYDTLYLGSGCGLQFPYETDNILDIHPERRSKCGDSYMVSKKAAQKIVNNCLPLYCNWDWELNYQQSIHEMNVYWVKNPMIYQGSEHGHYNTSC